MIEFNREINCEKILRLSSNCHSIEIIHMLKQYRFKIVIFWHCICRIIIFKINIYLGESLSIMKNNEIYYNHNNNKDEISIKVSFIFEYFSVINLRIHIRCLVKQASCLNIFFDWALTRLMNVFIIFFKN